MSDISQRSNLVIVRAGKNSQHANWLKQEVDRTWDLVVSRYEGNAALTDDDIHQIAIPGGKWDGLFKTFPQLRRPIDTYQYVWLPDDDIATDTLSINLMFSEMKQFKLLIGQPSLTWQSYFTYAQTLSCQWTRLRYTNMVELMMPCFKVTQLQTLIPYFENTATGWGLDWVWCRSSRDNIYRYALLDCCPMTHTRPLGTHLYQHAAAIGEDASRFMESVMSLFPEIGLDFKPTCYAAILNNGFRFGQFCTSACVALSYAVFQRRGRGETLRRAASFGLDYFNEQQRPDFGQLPLNRLNSIGRLI